MSFWPDRQILLRAQIAHDLLSKRVSLQGTAAGLWLIGYSVPLKVVRQAFQRQIATHYRRVRGRSRDELETGLWQQVERFVRTEARHRKGASNDRDGTALFSLTGQLLEVIFGVRDGTAPDEIATELASQMQVLANSDNLSAVKVEVLEEIVTWFNETASLRHQRNAIRSASLHDWTRARRITRLAVALLDRATATASQELHAKNRPLFTRLAVGWARLIFPILLVVVKNPSQRESLMRTLFASAAVVRRGPIRHAG